MSGLRFAAAATLGILALSGCSILDPFPTLPVPLSAGQTPPTGQRVAICYNTVTTSLPEVERLGQQECPANTVAELTDTDYHVQVCPLLIPGRATFLCRPKK